LGQPVGPIFRGHAVPEELQGRLHREWCERYLALGVMPAIRVDTA